MQRSTQTTSTRACNLRFVNNSSHTLDVLWLTYEGTEQKYAAVPPNSQHVQGTPSCRCMCSQQQIIGVAALLHTFGAATFTTHPWVIRDSEHVVSRYVGDTAVIEILPDLSSKVHNGQAKHVGPRPRPTPAHWGSYRSRCQVRGINIMVGHGCCCPSSSLVIKVWLLHACRPLTMYLRMPSWPQLKPFSTCCMRHQQAYVNG